MCLVQSGDTEAQGAAQDPSRAKLIPLAGRVPASQMMAYDGRGFHSGCQQGHGNSSLVAVLGDIRASRAKFRASVREMGWCLRVTVLLSPGGDRGEGGSRKTAKAPGQEGA